MYISLSQMYISLSQMCISLSQMYISFHVKYPLFLSGFKEAGVFSTYLQKTLKYRYSWNSGQWEASCFLRTNRRTDRHGEAN